MKINLRHIDVNGRKVRRKLPVYHAFISLIRKGIWYLDIDFKVRTDVSFQGSDDSYHLDIYFETDRDIYTVVEITSDEKVTFNVYARMSKTSYRGIIIDEKLVHRAIDDWNS